MNSRFFITQYKTTDKGINLNGARIYDRQDALRGVYVEIQAATDKGWRSKKAIAPDFAFNETSEGYGCDVLEIADDVAGRLIAQYTAVNPKIYSNWQGDGMAAAIYELSEKGLISDPSDTSGQFSRPFSHP